jgi:short-subunit dehydrogenase
VKIVILGASAWLGRRLAVRLAKRADKLILIARRLDRLQAVAEESGYKERIETYTLDLAKIQEIQEVSEKLVNSLGEIDIFLNVVGGDYVGRVKDCEVANFCQMFDAYVRGQTLFLSLLLPALRQAKNSLVINFLADWVTRKAGMECGNAIFSTTKAAMVTFSDCLVSEESQHGLAATNIYLGQISEQEDEELLERDVNGQISMLYMKEICDFIETILDFKSMRVLDVTLVPQQRSYARRQIQAGEQNWDNSEDKE